MRRRRKCLLSSNGWARRGRSIRCKLTFLEGGACHSVAVLSLAFSLHAAALAADSIAFLVGSAAESLTVLALAAAAAAAVSAAAAMVVVVAAAVPRRPWRPRQWPYCFPLCPFGYFIIIGLCVGGDSGKGIL